jgi:NAD(P)-dependent dehydrogenase (short-subunit alcohol dehydrogenase family)
MPATVDPKHLLMIGAGPGISAGVVRRFGREGFRSTLISRSGSAELASELREGGLEIEALGVDIADLDAYRETLEAIFGVPGAPGVVVYNAALPDPGPILDTTVEQLRTAYDVDVIGAVIAAQVAAPVLRAAGGGTLLATNGGTADNPVPALATLSSGKVALRSTQTLIAAGLAEAGIHAATVTVAGAVKPGTDFDPDRTAELFWIAHTDPKADWKTEYRFTGAQSRRPLRWRQIDDRGRRLRPSRSFSVRELGSLDRALHAAIFVQAGAKQASRFYRRRVRQPTSR